MIMNGTSTTATFGGVAAGEMRAQRAPDFHFGGCGILFLVGFSVFFCIALMLLSSH
jgi:hypothetical protein